MKAKIGDLPRVRAALARLDAVIAAHPELRSPAARARLRVALTPHEEPDAARQGSMEDRHEIDDLLM